MEGMSRGAVSLMSTAGMPGAESGEDMCKQVLVAEFVDIELEVRSCEGRTI